MGPLPMQDEGVIVRLVMESYLLAVPKHYQDKNIRLDKLCRDLPMIRFSGHTPSGSWTENYFRRFGFRTENSFEFDSASTVMAMVREGVGWTMITPLCLAQTPEHLAGVRFAPLPAPGYFRELQLLYRPELSGPIIQKTLVSISSLLKERLLPSVQSHVPWLSEQDFQVSRI